MKKNSVSLFFIFNLCIPLQRIFMKSILYISISLIALHCSLVNAKEAREITSMKEFKEIMSIQKPLVIMFYAPWCGACKNMKEPFNRVCTLLDSEANVIKINAEEEKLSEATDFFHIEAIPTIIIKHIGRVLPEDLVSSVKNLTPKSTATTSKNETVKKAVPVKKIETKTLPLPTPKQVPAKKPTVKKTEPKKRLPTKK